MATAYPIPLGRGRWRLTVHSRQFVDAAYGTTQVAELSAARSRRLEQKWNSPAQLSFALDGRDPAAALIRELQTDIMAWRWDDQPGAIYYSGIGCDRPLFRGIVSQSVEELTEQTHTITFTCHDYLSMMSRRFFTTSPTYSQQDQDNLVSTFVGLATNPTSASGQTFQPGGYLPILSVRTNPDSSQRSPLSAALRDRTYVAGADLYTTLDDLAKVIGGFDYDIIPAMLGNLLVYTPIGTNRDLLRVYYPYQGVQRFDVPLVYGSTVSSLTRTVDSGDYANFWRVIGQAPPNSTPDTPPMFSEQWNADSNNVTVTPIGTWMSTENAADVNIQATLDQKAQGDLATTGALTMGISPSSYTLSLREGAYRYNAPNMGDICPIVVQAGRLNLNDNIRVLGITYDIGDDGNENVSLTVGRPTRTLTQLLTQADRDADALTRRL